MIAWPLADLRTPGSPDTLVERALAAAGIHWHRGPEAAIAFVLATLLAGAGLVLASRRRGPDPEVEARPSPLPLTRLLVVAFVVVALFVVARFRFIEDDFTQIMAAVDHPWEMDDSLRLVSGALLYGAGRRLGTGWFMAMNLGVWVGSAALFHALLRRAGHTRDEAAIGAALQGLAPGWFPLVRSGIGFQTSLSIGLSYAVLILVDAAGRTRPEARARRAGLIVIALGLTAAGVLVKYPMMATVPFLAWVWGTRIVKGPPAPLSRHAFYASFAAAAGVPLLLAHPASAQAGELSKAGVQALAANAASLAGSLLPGLIRVSLAAAILSWGLGRGALREDLRKLGGIDRWGPFAMLAAIAAAPFLFNARYFAPYYVVPCWAWIAAVAAVPLAAAARRVERRGRVFLAAAVLVPLLDVAFTLDPRVKNEPRPLLDAARRATEGRPPPCGLILQAACPTSEATATSAADLDKLYEVTANGDGLRWATGWHAVDVAVEGDPGRGAIPSSCAAPLTLRYCAKEFRAVEAPR